jgi:quinol monooxygenase YgiN
MKNLLTITYFVASCSFLISCGQSKDEKPANSTSELMIRIAEIEVDPDQLKEYLAILKEESAESVKLEPGVIAIFPMFPRENPTSVRILEIYASKKAYESHLQTPHFRKYKTETMEMVKSLNLVDMEAIDPESLILILEKL